MFKITVIIPVYNAENTIERCIDSILNQKWEGNLFEDIEIIIVDDHSTDNSKKIITDYESKYPNISVFSTEVNTGSPSMPRNIGMEKAQAEYIMFIDNDDEYLEDICQTLYNHILIKDVDVVQSNFYVMDNVSTSKVNRPLNVDEYQIESDYIILDSVNSIFLNDLLIWNKIFKKDIIEKYNIQFPEKISEDFYFCINYFSKINKMIYLNNYYGLNVYDYDDSLGATFDEGYIIESIDGFMEVYELIEKYIDLNSYPNYKFNIAVPEINAIITKLSIMEDKTSKINCLNKLWEYENQISFDNSLDSLIFKFINYFILKKKFGITLILLDFLNFIKKSKKLRHIYRFFS